MLASVNHGRISLANHVCCRVGMLFLPNDDELAAQAKQIVEDVIASEGRCTIAGWRDVPVDHSIVGRMAKATEPRIVQVWLTFHHCCFVRWCCILQTSLLWHAACQSCHEPWTRACFCC